MTKLVNEIVNCATHRIKSLTRAEITQVLDRQICHDQFRSFHPQRLCALSLLRPSCASIHCCCHTYKNRCTVDSHFRSCKGIQTECGEPGQRPCPAYRKVPCLHRCRPCSHRRRISVQKSQEKCRPNLATHLRLSWHSLR